MQQEARGQESVQVSLLEKRERRDLGYREDGEIKDTYQLSICLCIENFLVLI